MKSIIKLVLVAVFSGATGMAVERYRSLTNHVQLTSAAGQTLVDLSRALEKEKEIGGEYPDSISELHVKSEYGDFSTEILDNVLYCKTEKGYIAFVGIPHVAYIYPGASTQYK